MNKGITIFLDVPLEVMAQRITDVGTASRPLLRHGSGDVYVKVAFFSLMLMYISILYVKLYTIVAIYVDF